MEFYIIWIQYLIKTFFPINNIIVFTEIQKLLQYNFDH